MTRYIGTLHDYAGTPVIQTKHVFVRINGLPVVTRTPFDNPSPHPILLDNPFHATPNLTPTHLQDIVRINSDRVSIYGDPATCGHTLEATGFPVIYGRETATPEDEYPLK